MSNEAGIVDGLVQKVRFNYEPIYASDTVYSNSPLQALNLFNRLTARVIRFADLSQPLENHPENPEEELCKKAMRIVQTVLKNKSLRNIPFTIIDGTGWPDVIESKRAGLDIVHINVYWTDEKPIIAVTLTKRMWIKNSKHWHREESHARRCTVWLYEPECSDILNVANIRFALFHANEQSSFYPVILDALKTVVNRDEEYPVAAAVYMDEVIYHVDRPYRHDHILHSREFMEAKAKCPEEKPLQVQGFLTNQGNFITRYRAMFLAVEKSMIIETGQCAVHLSTSSAKKLTKMDQYMGGILREADFILGGDYQIAMTPLTSEDLW